MASSFIPASRIVMRPLSSSPVLRQTQPIFRATSHFHTSSPRNATPIGPPPKGFRLPKPKRFDEGESAMTKASNYFLMTEMLRGMYVVIEQFFRPPYVQLLSARGLTVCSYSMTGTPYFIHLKKAPSRLGSVVSTPFEDTPQARNDASHASCAKLSVQHKLSQSKPRSEKTDRGEQQDTTLT